jgi:hypothetical protein
VFFHYNINWLMLDREVTGVLSENNTKHFNTTVDKMQKYLILKQMGQIVDCALKCWGVV